MVTILEDLWKTCNIDTMRNGWVKFITIGLTNYNSYYDYSVCKKYVMMWGSIITMELIDYNDYNGYNNYNVYKNT